ncbi:hypothetical protein P9112_005611 [Eukaryota sp. TZLM1-RC]
MTGFNAPPSNVLFEITPLFGIAEPFSSISHLLVAICLALYARLLFRTLKTKTARFGVGLYLFGCLFSMIVSSVYHMVNPFTYQRMVLRRLDHSAIFFMIAGTFTGGHLPSFKSFAGKWVVPSILWCLALFGVIMKTFFFDLLSDFLSNIVYLICGWLGIFSMLQLHLVYGSEARQTIKHLFLGGVFYSTGAIIALIFGEHLVLVKGHFYAHEVFHIFVAIGVYYHFLFVLSCVHNFHPRIVHRFVTMDDSTRQDSFTLKSSGYYPLIKED